MGAAIPVSRQVMSRVPAPDDEERDRDQRGGEGHEDASLDELERPEPVARLVGRERAVAEMRQARECGAYLLSRLARGGPGGRPWELLQGPGASDQAGSELAAGQYHTRRELPVRPLRW